MNDHIMETFYVCVIWILGWAAIFIGIYGGEHVVELWQYAVMFTPFFIFAAWQAMPLGNGDKE